MFGSFSPHTLTPSAASLQVSTTTQPAHADTPTSPTRSSRLRGLSYLRSYTHNHLHSHSPNSSSSSPTRPPLSRSNSTPTGGRRKTRTSQPTGVQLVQPQAQVSPNPQRGNDIPGEDTPTRGWLPTVGGQSGLSRVAPQPQPTPVDSSTSVPATMTRRRAATGVEEPTPAVAAAAAAAAIAATVARPEPTTVPADSVVQSTSATESGAPKKDMPTIRLIPHHEPRASKPSLTFPIITRTLASSGTRVRIGRYSERDSGAADALTNPLSTAPVGFKSKVVSRRHCEMWCENGQWFVKDVKSSSGTFLNHVRLSSPGMESRAYPVNDGDIVQLGIDFKGGEEQIFRCVKIRVECNRGWQKSLNQFNTSTHKRLLKSTQSGAAKDSDAQSTHSSECSICLCPVAPCQALFVAPCSHVWHYKCIRTLIYPSWPSFQCPNCRAYADLEADVDQPEEEEGDFEELGDVVKKSEDEVVQASTTDLAAATTLAPNADDEDLTSMMSSAEIRNSSSSPQPTTGSSASASDGEVEVRESSTATSNPLPILASTVAPVNSTLPESIMARSATPTSTAQFALAAGVLGDGGPITPMNDAGPFVWDTGSGRRARPVDGIAREPVTEEIEEK